MAWSSVKYRWQWNLKCCVTDAWNLIADANRLKMVLGLGGQVPARVGAKGGSNGKAASTLPSLIGQVQNVPVDWLRENEFSIQLDGEGTPLSQIVMKVRLEPTETGCVVTHLIAATPSSLMGKFAIPWAIGKEVYKNLNQLYADFDDYIQGTGENPFLSSVSLLTPETQRKLARASEKLQERGYRDSWVKLLMQYLALESDTTLQVMHPHAIANLWSVPKGRLVELFLSATELNVLRLRWQLRCPNCHDICASKMSLRGVRRRGHCSSCGIQFPNHLGQNVELAFTPHPSVRQIKKTSMLYTGPVAVPHIHIQQTLEPQEIKHFEADFLKGHYRIRAATDTEPTGETVDIKLAGAEEVSVEITDGEIKTSTTQEGSRLQFRLCNRTNNKQTVFIEDDSWKSEVLSAAEVVNNQQFRKLFPGEVMSINDPLPLGKVALLVADIADSTQLYMSKGDQKSYFLVREFYNFLESIATQHNGTIVKSMGDMALAAFMTPDDATAAALLLLKEIETFNATLSETECLKIHLGLHHGACFAANFNNVLDYFGQTVNIAWAIRKESKGYDMVMTRSMWRYPTVQDLVDSSKHTCTPFEIEVAGIDQPIELFRIH